MKRLKSFLRELKRRNIYKVAVTYALTGWIIMQIATSVFPALEFPEWTTQFVIILVLIGFPIALVFAWAFEVTPRGIRRTQSVPAEESITHQTGRKLNYWIISLLGLALILVLTERIWFAGTYSSLTDSNSNRTQGTAGKSSVAVLPFEDFSPQGDQQWFSDGLTEEILNSLARLPELRVPARTSSFLFRDTPLPVPEIADSLNVKHIVEGSVRRSGNQMRITVQLIQGKDGNHMWSKTYDASTDSVFKVQQDIAGEIATALNVYLDEEKRKRMFTFGTRNVDAYEAYLKGSKIYRKAHGEWQLERIWEANKWFERAYQLDSTFAAPYFKHADPYTHILIGDIQNPTDTLSLEDTYRLMRNDLNSAVQYTENPDIRLFYRYAREFLSQSWSNLPVLIQQIRNSAEAHEIYASRGPGWIEMLPSLGYAALAHQLQTSRIEQDPLNDFSKWFNALALINLEKPDKALKVMDSISNNSPFTEATLTSLIKSEQTARDIWSDIGPSETIRPGLGTGWRLLLNLDNMTVQELNAYVKGQDTTRVTIFVSYAAGYPQKANELARAIDSQFFGPNNLIMLINEMGSYIPFALSATPNLRRRFREADIQTQTDTLFGRPVQKIVQRKL